MAKLVLGPLLRHIGPTEATIWVETDSPCEVEVLGRTASTFPVEGHHYALVCVDALDPGSTLEYSVALDGVRRWPEPGSPFPPSTIRTVGPGEPLTIAFGSCRAPLREPGKKHGGERDVDALHALGQRMRGQPPQLRPHLLLLLGDQVYADEIPPAALAFIRTRRRAMPGHEAEVADFEEYTRLYWSAWQDPCVRWLLSTVSSAMIFDDHDVHDDWNISEAWIRDMQAEPWWEERIRGALASYWIYQHLGNLSPSELAEDELFSRVRKAEDGGPHLREFAGRVSRTSAATRWSYCRDLGRTRLVVIDTRAGRLLEGGRRSMLDDAEWAWLEERMRGDFDHLVLANSLPLLLLPALHHLEAWSEAVCEGAWGPRAARLGEHVRRYLDLEHWAAFRESFERMLDLIAAVAEGRRGSRPASVTVLSGDVHHGYVAQVEAPAEQADPTPVRQVVCSPLRNRLGPRERSVIRLVNSRGAERAALALAQAAGVGPPSRRWALTQKLVFDNQIGLLELVGCEAALKLERAVGPGDAADLETVFETRLS